MEQDVDWPRNYFNYFTEIEEHFRLARGSGLFMLSPLDWALIETWKNSGIPLEAVLRGIDAAFEKWRTRKHRFQAVNSLAFCGQAIAKEVQTLADANVPRASTPAAPFPIDALRGYLAENARRLANNEEPALQEISRALTQLHANCDEHYNNLEGLEQNLSALEEKMMAVARLRQTDDELLTARQELDAQLKPYRGRMTADQLSLIERKFLDNRLLETAGLRRLSLFYLGA